MKRDQTRDEHRNINWKKGKVSTDLKSTGESIWQRYKPRSEEAI